MPGYAEPFPVFLRRNAAALGFGALHAFFSSPGQTIVIGVFAPAMAAAVGLSAASVGALYLAGNLASGCTLIAIGHLIDSVPLRRFSAAVIAGLAAACLVAASATHAAQVWLAFYTLRLCGQGLMIHIEATATARAFEADRGRALGVTGLGLPLSDGAMPGVALALIGWFGWRGAWVALAGCLVLLVLPLAWRLAPTSVAPAGLAMPAHRRIAAALRLLARRRLVAAVLPAVFALPFVLTGLLFYASSVAAARGWTREAMAAAFPAMALMSVVAMMVSGRLVDRFSGRLVFALHALPLLGGLVLLAEVGADWAVPAGLLLVGASGGLAKTSGTAIWAELFGVAQLGTIRSFVAMFTVFSTAAAPFVFGLLVDQGWSWRAIIDGAAGLVLLLTAPLMLAAFWRGRGVG